MHRTTVLAVVALVSTVALVPPAHADNELSVSFAGGVVYDSCIDDEFTYSVALPAGYTASWDMTLSLQAESLWQPAVAVLPGPVYGVGTFAGCDKRNRPGTYTVIGLGSACDARGNCVLINSAPFTVTYRLPRTRVAITATPRRPKQGQTVRVAVLVEEERRDGFAGMPRAPVRIQKRQGGTWRTIEKWLTNDTGRLVVKVRHTGTPTRLRALTATTRHRTGSTSRTVRIG